MFSLINGIQGSSIIANGVFFFCPSPLPCMLLALWWVRQSFICLLHLLLGRAFALIDYWMMEPSKVPFNIN
jgi:hypothetical protein